ncbi:MAG: helix-turn-helix transcriptional regulator [Alphaproteobacteria bacterium]
MAIITPKQCKAARKLLDWTQGKLATAADLDPSTIVAFEAEKKSDTKTKTPSADSINKIHVALEKGGIIFTEGQGVRLRSESSTTYKGPNSCHNFFDEMLKDVKLNGGDILVFIEAHDILTRYSGEPGRSNNLERLTRLYEIADIKCLITDPPRAPQFLLPSFEMRVPETVLSPNSFVIHGDKLSFIYLDDCLDMIVLTIHESIMAQFHKAAFDRTWNNASCLKSQPLADVKHNAQVKAFA